MTPNLSYGGKKLQNQLEQVLMMKSGEFSAGGRKNQEALLGSAGSIVNVEHDDGLSDSRFMGQSQYQ